MESMVCKDYNGFAYTALECEFKMNAKDKSLCPDEAQILAFCEGTLWGGKRKNLEKHLSECDGCRESVALLMKAAHGEPEEASPEELERQSSLVMRMLENNRERQPEVMPGQPPVGIFGRRRLLWAGVVAAVALALGVPLAYRVYFDNSVIHQAMIALNDAQRGGRGCLGRVSGGIGYSPVHSTRGADGDTMDYERAEDILKKDTRVACSPEGIQMLARIRIDRDLGDDTDKALKALQELERTRGLSPELANDIGLALLQGNEAKDAIKYFTNALNLRPGYPEALFNRAVAEEGLAEQGQAQYQDAQEDWTAYIAGAPQGDGWLGEAQSRLHDVEEHLSNQPK